MSKHAGTPKQEFPAVEVTQPHQSHAVKSHMRAAQNFGLLLLLLQHGIHSMTGSEKLPAYAVYYHIPTPSARMTAHGWRTLPPVSSEPLSLFGTVSMALQLKLKPRADSKIP